MFFNMFNPDTSDKSHNHHGERASLRYRTPLMMNWPNGAAHLESYIDIVNVCEICIKDSCGHASVLCNLPNKFAVDLIKALKNIDGAPCNILS